MSRRSIGLTDALQAYLIEQTVVETDVMRRLREETARLPGPEIQIAQGRGSACACWSVPTPMLPVSDW